MPVSKKKPRQKTKQNNTLKKTVNQKKISQNFWSRTPEWVKNHKITATATTAISLFASIISMLLLQPQLTIETLDVAEDPFKQIFRVENKGGYYTARDAWAVIHVKEIKAGNFSIEGGGFGSLAVTSHEVVHTF